MPVGRVLVVEDYPPLAKVIAIGVGRTGHETERVGSVQRALSTSGVFDCSILDIDLPDGDGVALASRLVAEGRVARVVFYTACRDQEKRALARRYGPVVDKMDGLDRLLAAVAGELEQVTPALRVAGGGQVGGTSLGTASAGSSSSGPSGNGEPASTSRSGTHPRVR